MASLFLARVILFSQSTLFASSPTYLLQSFFSFTVDNLGFALNIILLLFFFHCLHFGVRPGYFLLQSPFFQVRIFGFALDSFGCNTFFTTNILLASKLKTVTFYSNFPKGFHRGLAVRRAENGAESKQRQGRSFDSRRIGFIHKWFGGRMYSPRVVNRVCGQTWQRITLQQG